MTDVPRMRMLAGPNGSGKSTIKSLLPTRLLGVDINPDEIERSIKLRGYLDLSDFDVSDKASEALRFFRESELLAREGMTGDVARIKCISSHIDFSAIEVNSYFASVAAAFIRFRLMEQGASFTFETVMSSPDKIVALQKARSLGFRTYLYYVATKDPEINIARVAIRVREGGHDVPAGKIVSRYGKSLALLREAIRHCNRAYIWDNSGSEPVLLAEVEDDELELKADSVPQWFNQSVLSKLE